MKAAVRYFSRSGNVKKLADAVADEIGVESLDVSAGIDDPVDVLFLGSSVYGTNVDEAVKKFIAELDPAKVGKIVNISTAAIISSTYDRVKKLAEERGIKMSHHEFHCRGKFLMMHKNHPDAADLEAVRKFAKRVMG